MGSETGKIGKTVGAGNARVATGLTVALAIAVAAVILPKLALSGAVARILTTQALELGLSLGAIAVFGRGRFANYGFRLPRPDRHWSAALAGWMPIGLTALGLGTLATAAMLACGGKGNPLVRELTFPQVILFVWIFSSTIEEVFTRGFLQSHIASAGEPRLGPRFLRIGRAALISAAFFAAMHLVLLLSHTDAVTVVIILLFTFSVGLLAAHQRERTGSLVPAIGVHMLANVGGVFGGIVYAIIAMLSGGAVPGR
ncbi:MAG TPA: CPBP family intramembrane metalloprotease [candidate division Zixibacteria bacterium]|nr:CPBP family intramembrane metalloprotease [candidate division Zixibacteria bacterium]MDD4916756.1 CPBP family intramembrane metalloprotease [candidate division Zixibacteria bacterium]HOD65348.1 CPBP family intramembrane metalloprotease [candidate division Zixibacteria bacterium]HOZ07703.1 CPBP family intramembrane metalloprotease [candidate division Zixibacteria bacterium]HPC11143.1 CPBP family intramembrane metalloprotease [candidate division Zixibacteria bacterium]